MDALSNKKELLALLEPETSARTLAVFLDIGGDRPEETVAMMLRFLLLRASPRLVVVKSECMAAGIASAAAMNDGKTTKEASSGLKRGCVTVSQNGFVEGAGNWFEGTCLEAEDKIRSQGSHMKAALVGCSSTSSTSADAHETDDTGKTTRAANAPSEANEGGGTAANFKKPRRMFMHPKAYPRCFVEVEQHADEITGKLSKSKGDVDHTSKKEVAGLLTTGYAKRGPSAQLSTAIATHVAKMAIS
eukprot:CAMPEP_0171923052 /NCGR_PEP_ID=MMETSP0993-20121228/21737_1 /TAXON_ID=483369 /ORGANISM="non described non described, Strain CCMP2098" /LENGTH=245 /DNA_ID=CAMNT_0012560919 /DNA_START=8 /DNA_END=743 /DNA_ORIENTATION=-